MQRFAEFGLRQLDRSEVDALHALGECAEPIGSIRRIWSARQGMRHSDDLKRNDNGSARRVPCSGCRNGPNHTRWDEWELRRLKTFSQIDSRAPVRRNVAVAREVPALDADRATCVRFHAIPDGATILERVTRRCEWPRRAFLHL
jgi:hypothetical protein